MILLDLLKYLLFNLSLLLVLLFFIQMWIERKGFKELSKGQALIIFLLSIVLCFLFSKEVNNQVRVDLRQIPLILGGLYFGLGLPIAGFLIFIRSLIGVDLGFWVSFILYGFLGVGLHLVHPWFLRQSFRKRMTTALLFAIFTPFTFLLVYEVIGRPIDRLDVWIGMMLVPALGTGVLAYSFESIKSNLLIREQVFKTQKLEAVSHMGAAISHEIRNPITAVKGFLQLMSEEKKLAAHLKTYVGISIQELERAEQVIEDYLTFAKPSLERIEEMDVHKELSHVLKVLEPLSNMNTVTIETQFAPIGIIQGDRNKFHQCFINIIKNSIEAMPNGGLLTIHTDFTEENLYIIITDTGNGMNEEQVARLGEPYYSSKNGKGTGLGMMVSFSLIRAMKGSVHTISQLGKGTTFTISFPQFFTWEKSVDAKPFIKS